MKQAYNPFLPLLECIPDGEPHVFGDRVYLFGSHEEEGGSAFCTLGYEFYSAPLNDLKSWTSKGVNYRAEQDPSFGKNKYLYAPDVVRGIDGRYYLYYAMSGGSFTGPIHVAVCDTPDGRYEYYGEVKNPDGTPFMRKITFDPAVLNDGGTIRLYYGWSLAVNKNFERDAAAYGFPTDFYEVQAMLFGKTAEEIRHEPDGIMGGFTVELAADMLTVKTQPRLVVPGPFSSEGTSFEGHAFFEASSIRKIGNRYYFIYSSEHQHELCYATSAYPDRGFTYGGVILSNGDVGYHGRRAEDRILATGNNHGSMENIGGEWYIFYHRQTHKTSFSRKACAERIRIAEDGSIPQVEMTSCGLNGGPLAAEGEYPAVICCELTNGHMPHLDPQTIPEDIPHITSEENLPFAADISAGTRIGFKYFSFRGRVRLTLTVRGGEGAFEVLVGGERLARITTPASGEWTQGSCEFSAEGERSLTLLREGEICSLRALQFCTPS